MYKLGKRSLRELIGVHPILGFAITEAIKITKQDFMVLDGVRTSEEQRKLIERGVSKTNDSYHLYGLAADLVAYVNGKPSWDEEHYYEISVAMKTVIEKHNLPIEWGYDMWKWDLAHWQMTGWKSKYDIRHIRS